VHAHGVVVRTRRGRDVICFEDVNEVWYELDAHALSGVRVARIPALRLVDHNGLSHRVELLGGRAVEALQWILRNCTDRLLEDARASLRQGETLTFANVRIDREGIRFGERGEHAWKDLRLVRLQPGRIAFFRGQTVFPWRKVNLDSVPHPPLFLKLVRELAPCAEIDDPLAPR